MSSLSYKKRGLVIKRGSAAEDRQIKDLQRDLRQLGYLRSGIDGKFGTGTDRAVRALQYDLMNNSGRSTRNDGNAPLRVLDFNRGRVVRITGEVDEKLAGCISDILDDTDFPKLPKSDNPAEDNSRIAEAIKGIQSDAVPIPFLMAILKQESGLKHYSEPRKNDEDSYIVVGLDTNASARYIITSRGYGTGQYTLFHHPPTKEEIGDFMLNAGKNVQKAVRELREKFDHFVNGGSPGTNADDRIAECGEGALILCKYNEGDPRYMRDCRMCMINAGQRDITEGVTPYYKGSAHKFIRTQYYKNASYTSVPVRKNIGCDWPYAVRRYNGAGINSYHYQVRILRNVLSA